MHWKMSNSKRGGEREKGSQRESVLRNRHGQNEHAVMQIISCRRFPIGVSKVAETNYNVLDQIPSQRNRQFLEFQGMDVVRKIESVHTDGRDKPKEEVKIEDCGREKVDEPFAVEKDDAKE